MVGEWRRRRRRRVVIRNVAGLVVAAVVVAVVVIVAVAAVAQIGPTSGPYYRTVDRSYVALAAPLAAQSNASGATLAAFWGSGSEMSRRAFFADLDGLVAATSTVARQFDALTPPSPVGQAGPLCGAAVKTRARAMASIRDALELLLGGRGGSSGGDEAVAAEEVVTSGSELTGADAKWAQCRRALRGAPGSARLPASTWISDPGPWAGPVVADFVAAAVASPSLAAVHGVAIVTTSTVPVAVAGSGGNGVVEATGHLQVDVVVKDDGNVDERGVEVSATTSPAGSSASRSDAKVNLAAGSSAALSLPSLPVRPGTSYTVDVTVSVPGGNGPGSSATTSFPIAVSAEPVVTTTTTTTTPSKTSKTAATTSTTQHGGAPG